MFYTNDKVETVKHSVLSVFFHTLPCETYRTVAVLTKGLSTKNRPIYYIFRKVWFRRYKEDELCCWTSSSPQQRLLPALVKGVYLDTVVCVLLQDLLGIFIRVEGVHEHQWYICVVGLVQMLQNIF